jgi:hydrogenase nickel incorporation protein HypA/HybF
MVWTGWRSREREGRSKRVHELAVTENLLQTAIRHAEAAGAHRVTDLHLVIGELTSIVGDSVQFYWDLVSQGTPCAGARLHFERVAARFRCQDCSTEYSLDGDLRGCPNCAGTRVAVVAGAEFRLESIEVDA